MRDIFLQELRECHKAIREEMDEVKKEQGKQLLLQTMEKMVDLASISREKGLLELEEETAKLDDFKYGELLKTLLLLIVDGTDPELVEEAGLTRLFSDNVSGYTALHYLIILRACGSIQAGENGYITKNRIMLMVPEELRPPFQEKYQSTKNSAPEDDRPRMLSQDEINRLLNNIE